jgi:uncharacterized membrane protein SirB2
MKAVFPLRSAVPPSMSYLAIKHLHMTCAALSGVLFFTRGILMLRASPLLQRRWLNTGSHAIDTVLLGSALTMAVWSTQYPFVQGWLTAKVIALVLYIVAGGIALKRGKTMRIRTVAFVVALLLFAYIVKVALTRQVI